MYIIAAVAEAKNSMLMEFKVHINIIVEFIQNHDFRGLKIAS